MGPLRRLRLLPCILAALHAPAEVAAFSVAPTVVMVDADSREPVRLQVAASMSSPLALELSAVERHGEGFSERLDASISGEIEIHPPQVFLPPGTSTEVSLRWKGGPHQGPSRSFYLVAEEMPLAGKTGNEDQSVRLLARFFLPIHVLGDGKPDLRTRVAQVGSTQRLEIENAGTAFARLSAVEVKAAKANNTSKVTRTIPGSVLARAAQVDAILPSRTIGFSFADIGLQPDDALIELVVHEQ